MKTPESEKATTKTEEDLDTNHTARSGSIRIKTDFAKAAKTLNRLLELIQRRKPGVEF